MRTVTIDAGREEEAIEICRRDHFWPDAVREVDSGNENTRAWLCFEDASDALVWDQQK
jgi:hypothetical protein